MIFFSFFKICVPWGPILNYMYVQHNLISKEQTTGYRMGPRAFLVCSVSIKYTFYQKIL